jgi:hypothetical protein
MQAGHRLALGHLHVDGAVERRVHLRGRDGRQRGGTAFDFPEVDFLGTAACERAVHFDGCAQIFCGHQLHISAWDDVDCEPRAVALSFGVDGKPGGDGHSGKDQHDGYGAQDAAPA